MFREQGFATKESEAGGTKGNRALMALPNPKGAFGALVGMPDYAPEGYKFKYATNRGGSFSSGVGRPDPRPPGAGASTSKSSQPQEHPGTGAWPRMRSPA